jgi:hypothetical protein
MARKTFEQKIEEAKVKYIEGFLEEGSNSAALKLYEDNLRETLRALRLRERDVVYHVRDAYARATGERSRRRRG